MSKKQGTAALERETFGNVSVTNYCSIVALFLKSNLVQMFACYSMIDTGAFPLSPLTLLFENDVPKDAEKT